MIFVFYPNAVKIANGYRQRSNSLQLMKKLHFGLGQMYLHFWFISLVLQIGQKSHQFSSSATFAV